MLLPFFGFVFGMVASALLGAAVIALHPRWKLTLANIAWFVSGAFAGAIGSSLLYTWARAYASKLAECHCCFWRRFTTIGSSQVLEPNGPAQARKEG